MSAMTKCKHRNQTTKRNMPPFGSDATWCNDCDAVITMLSYCDCSGSLLCTHEKRHQVPTRHIGKVSRICGDCEHNWNESTRA